MKRSTAEMRVPRWLVRSAISRPRATLGAWVVILAISLIGVRSLEVDTSTDSVLDRSDPVAWPLYQKSLEIFGGDEIVVVALPSPAPYDPPTLALVKELTERLQSVPGIRRVDSLSSVPLIEVTADGTLSLEPSLSDDLLGHPVDRSGLAEKLARDGIARRVLVSDDGRLFAVNAFFDDDVGGRFEAIVDEIRAHTTAKDALISGVPVFRTAINTKTASEVGGFVVLTILVISLLLYFLFNSIIAVVIPLAASIAGTITLLAAMGFVGEPLSLTTMVLPSIMLAIGCANVMHVITQAVGVSDPVELERSLDPVILPALLSGLTTTFGFLAISGVPIDAVRATGTYGAVGVLTVLAATLTAVPAALTLWPLPRRAMRPSMWLRENVCPALCDIALRRRRSVLAVWAVLTVVAAIGVTRLKVETDATTWFPRDSAIRTAYEQIRDDLSGISPVNVLVESESGEAVTKPEVLAALAGLSEFLESLPEVGRAISIVDPLRQIHQGFAGDGKEGLPSSPGAIEQYLLLLESVEQIRDLVSVDRAHANVILRVDNNGSEDLQRVAGQAEEWWRLHGAQGYSAHATGVMYEFARAEDKIAIGQVRGMGFALMAIGVTLLMIFRDVRLTIATMVTNAAPILLGFSAMGFLGLPLDAGTVVVGNLAIGIAIDETLHLASGLRGLDSERERHEVLLEALELCVPSILYTTAAIALGFGVLGLSEFSFTRDLGVLTAGVMVLCVVADLFLLPALVLRSRS